ncbi:uncharacterized protein C18orf63-like [Liolophura sinensis]|uniref:uncharacterized protein C18orf63-like n=1 Tax=Liolophura sinensis TaxID=3198878 RepID=UPI003158B281
MMLGKPSSNNKPVLLFSNPPNFEELYAISLLVTNPQQGVHSSRNQTRILKCRELIFTEPDIIATPSFGDDCSITLILQHSVYVTGRLQARFQRIGLKASKPSSVTQALFQACMMYTLHAKLAPSWNKAGQWLLQGRDFLTRTSCLNAVKMSLTVTANDVSMALQATALRTSPYQLNDLNLPTSVQKEFLNEPQPVIPETFLMNSWCHVLPSMKKGKIVGVSRVIPEDSPFKTYRDLKRHWKNTYGYRLPDTDDNILYYQIYFGPVGHTLFTYPHVCLRSREFHVLPRVDPRSIYVSFLQDVTAKMPTVCGQCLSFKPKVKYAKPGLSAVSENLKQSNLSNRILKANYTTRDPSELQNMYDSRSQNGYLNMKTTTTSVSAGNLTSSTNQPIVQPEPIPQSPVNKVVNSSGKIVPLFRTKVAPVFNVTPQKRAVEKKLVPVFRVVKTAMPQNIPGPTPIGVSSVQDQYSRLDLLRHNINMSERRNPTPPTPGLFERAIDCPVPLPVTRPNTSVPGFNPFLVHDHLEGDDFQLPCPATWTSQEEFVGKSAKRKARLESPVVKKPRGKPQVHESVNVEVLAKTHQLSKVNAATLVAWMKEHNIPCKAKDKKTELMDKVNSFLQVSASEQ